MDRDDPFASLLPSCHVTPSQQDSTPPPVVSSAGQKQEPIAVIDDVGSEGAVDLGNESDNYLGSRSTQLLNCTGIEVLGSDLGFESSKGGDFGVGVVDLDGDHVFDEMPVRNHDKGIGVEEDENRGFAEMNADVVVGVDGDNLAMRNREVEIGIDKGDGEPRRYQKRGFGEMSVDDSESTVAKNGPNKDDGQHRDGKRKIPVMNTEAEIGSNEGDDESSGDENRRFVERFIEEICKLRYVGPRELPSSIGGQVEKNELTMGLLNSLRSGTGDVVVNRSEEKVDFVKTAMSRGIKFPRPSWWPPEGSPDD